MVRMFKINHEGMIVLYKKAKNLVASIVLLSFIGTIGIFTQEAFGLPKISRPPVHDHTFGMYWYASAGPSIDEPNRYLDFAAANGINEIYLSTGVTAGVANLGQNVNDFVSAANEREIQVFFLTGHYNWILPAYYENFKRRMDEFLAYQESAAENEQFAGVVLNIEPQQFRPVPGRYDYNWLTPVGPERDRVRNQLLQYYIDFQVYMTELYGPMDWTAPAWWRAGYYEYQRIMYNGEPEWLYRATIMKANRIHVMAYRNTPANILHFARNWVAFSREENTPIILINAAFSSDGSDNPATNNVDYRHLGRSQMARNFNIMYETENNENLGFAVYQMRRWLDLPEWRLGFVGVYFHTNDGTSSMQGADLLYGDPYYYAFREISVPTLDGYEFIGWFNEDGYKVAETDIVATTEHHALHAGWRPVSRLTPIIAEIFVDNGNITVLLNHRIPGAFLFVVVSDYDDDGAYRMSQMEFARITPSGNNDITTSLTAPEQGGKIKAFVWSSINLMQPYCNHYEKRI